ncbi:protein-tyrosine-phosphatase [Rhizobium mongolense]
MVALALRLAEQLHASCAGNGYSSPAADRTLRRLPEDGKPVPSAGLGRNMGAKL